MCGQPIEISYEQNYILRCEYSDGTLIDYSMAVATIARCFPLLVAILLNTAARIGSIFIALHAASTKTYRKRLAPWRVICPRLVFSPEECSLGVKPVKQKRERSFLNCFMSPSSFETVLAASGPMPGALRYVASFSLFTTSS